jgi:hypothetical protein
MVIDIVNVPGFAIGEAKDDSPVRANSHCPKPPEFAFERMQPESGQVHIRNIACGIKTREDVAQFFRVFRVHATRVIVFTQALQSFVAERSNHFRSVTRNVTRVK